MTEEMMPNPEEQDAQDEASPGEAEPSPKNPLEQFIFHQRRGLEEFGKAMESLLPPGFKEHTHAASSEFATGFRVLIDAAIDEIKKASEMETADAEKERRASANLAADDDDDPTAGSSKIKVELDD